MSLAQNPCGCSCQFVQIAKWKLFCTSCRSCIVCQRLKLKTSHLSSVRSWTGSLLAIQLLLCRDYLHQVGMPTGWYLVSPHQRRFTRILWVYSRKKMICLNAFWKCCLHWLWRLRIGHACKTPSSRPIAIYATKLYTSMIKNLLTLLIIIDTMSEMRQVLFMSWPKRGFSQITYLGINRDDRWRACHHSHCWCLSGSVYVAGWNDCWLTLGWKYLQKSSSPALEVSHLFVNSELLPSVTNFAPKCCIMHCKHKQIKVHEVILALILSLSLIVYSQHTLTWEPFCRPLKYLIVIKCTYSTPHYSAAVKICEERFTMKLLAFLMICSGHQYYE